MLRIARRFLLSCGMDTECFISAPDPTHQISDPRLRRLYQYWIDRRGDRRFPARSDIDPIEFSYALGSIMLIDVLRDPLRFRVRLHGSDLVSRDAHDLTGKLLDDLPRTDFNLLVIERCNSLVATGEPTLVHLDRMLDGRHRRYEAIWLPLSDDGSNVTMLLCALIYRDRWW
jgi:hypothetical protein